MQHTQNYQLSRWEKDDRIMMEDFNADNEKIDAALAAKADAEDVTALGETVAALAAGLGSGGQNCRIAWGSYTGNNSVGSSHPTSLTFDFKPVWVYIAGHYSTGNDLYTGQFLRPSRIGVGPLSMLPLTWSDRGVSWYVPSTTSGDLNSAQLNNSACTYWYVALGVAV